MIVASIVAVFTVKRFTMVMLVIAAPSPDILVQLSHTALLAWDIICKWYTPTINRHLLDYAHR